MEYAAVPFREDIVPYRQSRNSLARGAWGFQAGRRLSKHLPVVCVLVSHPPWSSYHQKSFVPYHTRPKNRTAALTMTPWHSGRWVLPRLRPTFLKLGLYWSPGGN